MQIRNLFISPGHNYFGHHGKPPSEHATIEVDQIRCVAGRGIEGDRFFDYKPEYKGQITFFSWEVFERLCASLGIHEASPAGLRRNVVCDGADLNALIGKEFELQGLRFSGVEECRPCYWMDQAYAPGAEQALRGFGGLRARILSDGVLRRD